MIFGVVLAVAANLVVLAAIGVMARSFFNWQARQSTELQAAVVRLEQASQASEARLQASLQQALQASEARLQASEARLQASLKQAKEASEDQYQRTTKLLTDNGKNLSNLVEWVLAKELQAIFGFRLQGSWEISATREVVKSIYNYVGQKLKDSVLAQKVKAVAKLNVTLPSVILLLEQIEPAVKRELGGGKNEKGGESAVAIPEAYEQLDKLRSILKNFRQIKAAPPAGGGPLVLCIRETAEVTGELHRRFKELEMQSLHERLAPLSLAFTSAVKKIDEVLLTPSDRSIASQVGLAGLGMSLTGTPSSQGTALTDGGSSLEMPVSDGRSSLETPLSDGRSTAETPLSDGRSRLELPTSQETHLTDQRVISIRASSRLSQSPGSRPESRLRFSVSGEGSGNVVSPDSIGDRQGQLVSRDTAMPAEAFEGGAVPPSTQGHAQQALESLTTPGLAPTHSLAPSGTPPAGEPPASAAAGHVSPAGSQTVGTETLAVEVDASEEPPSMPSGGNTTTPPAGLTYDDVMALLQDAAAECDMLLPLLIRCAGQGRDLGLYLQRCMEVDSRGWKQDRTTLHLIEIKCNYCMPLKAL